MKCTGNLHVHNVQCTNSILTSVDVDECAQDNILCDQICMNTFGSYECSCEPGYRLSGEACEGKNSNNSNGVTIFV